jgi:hypothetical protein
MVSIDRKLAKFLSSKYTCTDRPILTESMREPGLYFVQVYNVQCTFVDTCRCVRPQRWGDQIPGQYHISQRCTEIYEDITHLCLLYNVYILGSCTVVHTLLKKKGNLEESRAQLYSMKTLF